jgi:hypothetical protein
MGNARMGNAETNTPNPGSTSMPAMEQWYLESGHGASYGPVSRQELDRWHFEGRIEASATLRRTSDGIAIPASTLYPDLVAKSVNPFADQPSNPYLAATAPNYSGRPHRGGWILALGTGSLVASFFSCCPFMGIPSLGMSIAALILGFADLRGVQAGEMDPSGRGLAIAGMICGGISVVFALGGVAFFLLSLAAG